MGVEWFFKNADNTRIDSMDFWVLWTLIKKHSMTKMVDMGDLKKTVLGILR